MEGKRDRISSGGMLRRFLNPGFDELSQIRRTCASSIQGRTLGKILGGKPIVLIR